jgi:two-component system, LuxR family, response regulator FixJ
MPGMSGFDVLRALHDAAGRPPVIIMSSHDDVSARVHFFAAGAKAYLCKPFDDRVLLDAILKALNRGRIASSP